MIVKKTIPIALSTIIIALVHSVIYKLFFENNNILYFTLLFGIFSLSYVIIYFLTKKIDISDNRLIYYFLTIDIIFAIWFIICYFNENKLVFFDANYSLRHRVLPIVYFVSFFCSFVIILIALRKIKSRTSILRLCVAIAIALLQSVVLIAPNIMNDLGGNLFHIHAYFNPIYNISDFRPVNEIIRSIYGNYSFFYILPMNMLKIFGIPGVYSAMIINSVVGLIAFSLLYWGLNRLIKNDVLYLATVFACCYISFYYYQSGQYYQVLPHRLLFFCILIFMLSKKHISYIESLIYSSLSILWNFETGIICSFSLSCFLLFNYLKDFEKKSIIEILKYASIVFLGPLFAYSLFNMFNLLLGGDFQSVKSFIFPLASDDYVINELTISLPNIFSIYYIEFVLFAGSLVYYIYNCVKKVSIKPIFLALSILGLGLSPYYINRPAYANVSIVHIPFIILLVLEYQFFVEKSDVYSNKLMKQLIYCFIPLTLLTFFILGSLTGIPLTINNRINSSWKVKEYERVKQELAENIPDDVPAAGPGLTDVYSTLDRDPQIYLMDWSDWTCSEKIIDYAVSEIESKDSLLFNNSTGVADYIDLDDWIMVDYLCNEFYYIIKIDSEVGGRKENILKYADDNNFDFDEFINLCFLDLYKSKPDDLIKDYYKDNYSDYDYKVLYDVIYDDYKEIMEENF